MPGKKGMRKTIRWDDATRRQIVAAWEALRAEGWERISIRKVLYKLLDLPEWNHGTGKGKPHYDTLCTKTGEWRDNGDMPFGMFSDEGGDDYIPFVHKPATEEEIEEEIRRIVDMLRSSIPPKLDSEGFLNVVLVEHGADVHDISRMLDGACVVSSGGQLRREHLHVYFTRLNEIIGEWNVKGIRAIMLVDYDKGGKDIFEAHRKWLHKIFRIELRKWGITPAQIRAAGLPVGEDAQIEGWSGRYGHDRLRRELRAVVGLEQ